jgi:nitrogen-specific signal transduction histidine kinase
VERSLGVAALEKLARDIAAYFRDLLGTVTSYGQVLHLEMDHKDPLKEYVRLILAHAKTGKSVADRLLAYGERGRVNLRLLNINSLVEELSRLLSLVFRKRIRLHTALTDQELPVMADPNRIGQAFVSLVKYGAEALNYGSLMMVTTRRIPVKTDPAAEATHGGCALLRISSVRAARSGLDRQAARKPARKGISLGLSAIRRIIEEHRGVFRVTGQRGKALEFSIYLPIFPVSLAPVSARLSGDV